MCNIILIEKLQKNSEISSGKTDKYEYLTGREIFPLDQSRIVEQPRFTYSTLRKIFLKTNKPEQKARNKYKEKQLKSLEKKS